MLPPPPQNSNNLHPPLRRVRNGIPAGLAVCILTLAGILAAPEAQAQTPTEKCTNAGWSVSDVFCSIKVHEVVGSGNHSNRVACQITNLGLGTVNDLCTNIFGADLAFPQKPTDGSEPEYVYNCDPNGSKGLIPATINTIGATECTCPAGQVLQDGVCAVCPVGSVLRDGVCVNCITGASAVDGVCTCPAGEVPLTGECGTCGDGEIVYNSACTPESPKFDLPEMALDLYNRIDAVDSDDGSLFVIAIKEFKQGILDRHNGVADYIGNLTAFFNNVRPNQGAYSFFLSESQKAGFGQPNFQVGEVERILMQIPVRTGSSTLLWSPECRSAGWTFSLDGGGSCGIPLTLPGGAVSNKCNLSGSDSPQCDAVFGSTVNYFPSPALSADGATLRFVYNCNSGGNTDLIPATINTIGATECTCATAGEEEVDGACVPACTETESRVDGICVANSVLDKCESAGWSFSESDGSCGILLTLSGGDPADKCYFAGDSSPQCADVFGSTLHYFPSPTLSSENATLRFVYNCDPDDENGLFPATANTIAATECMCAAGEEAVGGVCVSSEMAAGARNCLEAEREFSAESGGSCAVAITLSGGTLYSRCHFSGTSEPKCDAVFGAEVMFPSVAVAGPFIYNCDPDDENGLIPAQSNTVEATECACPAGGQSVTDGICACPSGQGVLSDSGICGVCPVGQDVIGGLCLPGVIMGQCVTVGWSFSAADGGSCGVLLTLAGGESVDRCYVSGVLEPQCEEVFASTVHYFPSPTLAADGATLRFVYNCDPDGESGLIPATANTIAATECGCESGASLFNDVCIREEGDLGLADELLCGAFGGTVQTATGGKEVCSGMDANDTFCIMDSAAGFPCRGLFKHLRSCNLEFNRKALNPFFCGEKCGVQKAVGSECR